MSDAGRPDFGTRRLAAVPVVLRPLASLQLTVLLLVLGMMLTFAGTLAQVEQGVWQVVNGYFRTLIAWIDLGIFFPARLRADLPAIPFPGGWLIGGLLVVNLLAAHAVRFRMVARRRRLIGAAVVLVAGLALLVAIVLKIEADLATMRLYFLVEMVQITAALGVVLAGCYLLFGRRGGIVLLHAGLIVLLCSELVTGLTAEEGQMVIREGAAANYVEDIREVELAVIDATPDQHNQVVAVPESMLAPGERITHVDLPFDMEVLRYMSNAQVVRAGSTAMENPATAGVGLQWVAQPRPPVSGADPDQRIDSPAVYIRLIDATTGDEIGVYLLALVFAMNDLPQVVAVGEQTREIALRFRRTYKPYTIHLLDFSHDRYLGTDVPKNFSSRVRLVDPKRNEDREVLIYMNHPLRYEGETFYQASFLEGDRGTVLQVVKNPGWALPYVSCAAVSLGLTAHFGVALFGFLEKRRAM